MTLSELKTIICKSGGKKNALEYAPALLGKIKTLEQTNRYTSLFKQFNAARNEGDLRGRVLEINFAERFENQPIALEYGAKQQGTEGDVDFCWTLGDHKIFIEMKMLGQDDKTKNQINEELEERGRSTICRTDHHHDIGRIQRDIFQKSSTTKFNPTPENKHINLVAIDVSELQLEMIDLWDCILAVGGNEYVTSTWRVPRVVGAFETENPKKPYSAEQKAWIDFYHSRCENVLPRTYIHGILFLFREPRGTAVLSYELTSLLIRNVQPTHTPSKDAMDYIEQELYRIIPKHVFP